MSGRKTHVTFSMVSVALSVLFVALAIRCTSDVAGGSSEIGNGVVLGKIVDGLGGPACSTIVCIMPSEYDLMKNGPLDDTCTDTTDADGIFRFVAQHGHNYSIQAVHMGLRTRVFVPGVAMENADLAIPQCTLQVPGAVRVSLPDTVDSASGYVYVPGSEIYALLRNGNGFVMLDSVPAGVIPAVYYSSITDSVPVLIRYDVPVLPGNTTVVDHPSWKHARRLYLNTTASGAGVFGTVYGFPVLVRLNDGNFSFTQAKADGGDLRFTKVDGTPLPHEIVRYDPVARRGDIWVLCDTVYGNDGTRFFTMYWGNPAAENESDGPSVFDSASGFEGVWHLGETSGTRVGDASYRNHTGTYHGGLPNSERGPSGTGQNIMRPDTDYVDMGNVLNPGQNNISISVWLKRRTTGTQQALVAKTNGEAPSATYGYLLTFEASNLPRLYLATGGTAWGDDYTFGMMSNLAVTDSTQWHHVFVVVDRSDNALCRMYIDGIDRTGVTGGNVARISAVSNALNLRIGTENDNNCSYSGAIGEITVAFTARSADWVKLSYANQNAGDRLVEFGRK